MSDYLVKVSVGAALALSLVASIIQILFAFKKDWGLTHKIFVSILILVPLVGPALGLVILDSPPPQSPHLKNNLPWGFYSDNWASWREMQKSNAENKLKGDK